MYNTCGVLQLSSGMAVAANGVQLAEAAIPFADAYAYDSACDTDAGECASDTFVCMSSIQDESDQDLSGVRTISGGNPAGPPPGENVRTGSTVHAIAVERGSPDEVLRKAIRDAMHDSIDLNSVIRPGDNVFILTACNSEDPYPATVHPLSYSTVVDEFRLLGANVKAGCLSGIEFVLQTPTGTRGSSRDCAIKSGMIKPDDKYFVGLEMERMEEWEGVEGIEEWEGVNGWEKGFRLFTHPDAIHWPYGFHVSRIIDWADHIFSLCRAGAHAMARMSVHGKNGVGYVRMDSRMDFHEPGPMNWFMRYKACGSGLRARRSLKPDFFERIAEINLATKLKMRGGLCVATKYLTTRGPNSYLIEEGDFRCLKSYVDWPEIGYVVASDDNFAAGGVIGWLLANRYEQTPWWDRVMQKGLVLANGQIDELETGDIYKKDRVIRRALEIGLGRRAAHLEAPGMPADLRERLKSDLGIPG